MTFTEFARCHGVEISELRQGDKIYRCPTTAHPRSENGAYWFDGRKGWAMNWETGEPAQWWNDENAKPWTDREKHEWARNRKLAEAAKGQAYDEAIKRAAVAIKDASRGTHQYLIEKGFKDAIGLIGSDGELIIPMRDCQSGQLLGLQTIDLIDNVWKKKMLHGMRAKGAVLRLGPPKAVESCLVEGYADGLSVDAALRLLKLNAAVVICFSAGNLVYVSQLVTGRRYIYADNDVSRTGEKSAIATGLPYCMSDTVGNDPNDDHQQKGIMAVAKKIMEARKKT